MYVTGKIFGAMAKFAFVGVLVIGHLVMNVVGLLVCAVTEG